jgi:hypothetical protein
MIPEYGLENGRNERESLLFRRNQGKIETSPRLITPSGWHA